MTLTLFLTVLGMMCVSFGLFLVLLLVAALKAALLLSPIWAPPLVGAWRDHRRAHQNQARA